MVWCGTIRDGAGWGGGGVQTLSSQAALRKEGQSPRASCGSDSQPRYQGRDSAEDPPPFSDSLLPPGTGALSLIQMRGRTPKSQMWGAASSTLGEGGSDTTQGTETLLAK